MEENNIVLKELPIADDSKQVLIEARISIYYDESDLLAERMFSGEISLGQYEELMKKALRELHTAILAITRGGWDKVSFVDWGRIGTPLREQYKYLHGFVTDISNNRDTISLAMIKARARLYGKAAWHTHFMFQAGDFVKLLPWIPRDGSTECLIGCQCRWELKVSKYKNNTKTVVAIWKLCDAEHCLDCVNREDHTVTLEVSLDTEIPEYIGKKC